VVLENIGRVACGICCLISLHICVYYICVNGSSVNNVSKSFLAVHECPKSTLGKTQYHGQMSHESGLVNGRYSVDKRNREGRNTFPVASYRFNAA